MLPMILVLERDECSLAGYEWSGYTKLCSRWTRPVRSEVYLELRSTVGLWLNLAMYLRLTMRHATSIPRGIVSFHNPAAR